MQTKHLNVSLELKENTEPGIIEGYAAVFGNTDLTGDVIDKGAFKKSLRESKGRVPILSHHNPYKQIGWNLEAEEDERGLKVKGWLDIESNAMAREHWSLIKKAVEIKAKPGLSIGFYTIKAEPDRDNPTLRRIKEVRLIEYSPVVFPANPEATALSAKGIFTSDTTLVEGCEAFLEAMIENGHTQDEIKSFFSSLRTGAEGTANDPDPKLIQSIADQLKQLNQSIKGK